MLVDNPRRAREGGNVSRREFPEIPDLDEPVWVADGKLRFATTSGRDFTPEEEALIERRAQSVNDVEETLQLRLWQDAGELRTLIRSSGTTSVNRLFARALLKLILLQLRRVDTVDPDATGGGTTTPAPVLGPQDPQTPQKRPE